MKPAFEVIMEMWCIFTRLGEVTPGLEASFKCFRYKILFGPILQNKIICQAKYTCSFKLCMFHCVHPILIDTVKGQNLLSSNFASSQQLICDLSQNRYIGSANSTELHLNTLRV